MVLQGDVWLCLVAGHEADPCPLHGREGFLWAYFRRSFRGVCCKLPGCAAVALLAGSGVGGVDLWATWWEGSVLGEAFEACAGGGGGKVTGWFCH
jgi:hypothetical protein